MAGFENLRSLDLRLAKRPPAGMFNDLPQLKNFRASWGGFCGAKLTVNGVLREVITKDGGCLVSFGDW